MGNSTLGRIPQNSNKKCQLCSLTTAQGLFLPVCIWSCKDLTGSETGFGLDGGFAASAHAGMCADTLHQVQQEVCCHFTPGVC